MCVVVSLFNTEEKHCLGHREEQGLMKKLTVMLVLSQRCELVMKANRHPRLAFSEGILKISAKLALR